MLAARSRLAHAMTVAAMVLLAAVYPVDADQPKTIVSELRLASRPLISKGARIAQTAADLTALPLFYRDCTSIVYQFWQDDNWEIVIAQGDGSAPLRLTNNLTYDEAPSMGLGCGQIAFGADRDDNKDIYLMQSDGTGLQRLTSQPARDVLPALAPDSASVAFQSYRHGEEPEVYLVTLNTGAETRITNNQIYDGQPDWSPDGQQIAYISESSDIKNVWIMDSDGSNPRQITDMPHTAAPKWSPDGQRIAFASDDIGTGFTSLWVVNQDGSGARLVWRAYGSQTDAWPDDWSFDSRYILYEEANWDYDAGWYITSASLNVIDPNNTSDRQRLIDDGVNMAAAWALCDTAPPVTTLAPLASISNSPLALSWSGQDDRSSYIEYQVQYQPGGQRHWTTWQLVPGYDWSPVTSGQFVWNDLGRTLGFRVRAQDILGRVGDWAPGPAGATTIIPARISGYVRDARGVPLADASLSAIASPLPSAKTGINGRYELVTASDWSTQLLAQAPGYVTQTLDRPALAHMSQINYRLMTSNEALLNGGFEAGLAGWYAAGAVAHLTPGYALDKSCVLLGAGAANTLSQTEPAALGSSSVYQRIVVPTDAAHPTLSLAYALGDGSEGAQGTLRVSIQTGDDSRVMFATSRATPWSSTPSGERYPLWQYAYVDLGPWRGQAITVTCQHQQHFGSGSALVDQISVSPWLTPYLTEIRPRMVSVGQATQIRMRGYNLSSATKVRLGDRELGTSWLGDTLLAQVPGDLAPGQYNVWVINPGGYASAQPLAFSIGSYFKLPLIIRS